MIKKLAAMAIVIALPFQAYAEKLDKRAGYYYPPITSEEIFDRTIAKAPKASSAVRTAFVTEITKSQLSARTEPRFVVFTKGSQSEHLIVIAVDDEIFGTLFRARAVMAQFSSKARSTPFFKKHGIQFDATWYDLAKILGFEDIVLSDGKSWAHRVTIE